MEIAFTLWQLTGAIVASVVGIATIISLLVASGIRIGKFATRDDLDKTSQQLEKKIRVRQNPNDWKGRSTRITRRSSQQSKTLATASRLPYWSIRTTKMA